MSARSAQLLAGLLLALVAASTRAHAQMSIQACSDAYTLGQEERLAGRLSRARGQFVACSDPACPGAIVRDCSQWKGEVEAELPTIRVSATDEAGRPLDGSTLTVTLDGARVPSAELAAPILCDPGAHTLHFEAPGLRPTDVALALKPEQRNVAVAAALPRLAPPSPAAPPKAAPEPAARSTSAARLVAVSLATVGVVALGGSLYFGLRAKSQYDDLKKSCAPSCAPSQRDSVHQKAVASDIALAVSAIALGTAAWLYLSSSSDAAPTAAVALEPARDGARAHLQLSF